MRHKTPVMAALAAAVMFIMAPTLADAQVHEYITSWGGLGSSGEVRFNGPTGVAIDYLGNVYVADTGNAKVQKYNNVGGFIAEWSSAGNSTLASPTGVAIAGETVYVVDKSLNSVAAYDLDGNYKFSWGQNGAEPGQFVHPLGIKASDDAVYVADTGNSRVQAFTLDGNHTMTFRGSHTPESGLESPVGIALDSDGTVFVSDPTNMKIYHYDSEGAVIAVIDVQVGGTEIGAHGIVQDKDGRLYVADNLNDRIILIDSDGLSHSVWGGYGIGIYQFISPTDVAIDPYGQLFVIDSGSHSVKKFTTPHTVFGDERTAAREAARATFEDSEAGEQTESESPPPESQALSATIVTKPQSPAQRPAESTDLPAIVPVPGDLKKPTIHAPHDITIEAVDVLTVIDIGMATASDESGILSITNNAPDAFTLGTNTVIWTAIDGARNTAIDTQVITIVDTIPPVIEEIDDVILEAASPDRNHVDIKAPSATDTVGVLDITSDAPEYFAIGRTQVTWTAHDIVGNTASSSHYVTITDTTPPQIRAPQDITLEATDMGQNEVFLGDPVVIDNGEVISITNDAPQTFALGTTTVMWTAADSHGNIAHDTQVVTLTDTTPPDTSALADVIVEATSATQNVIDLPEPAVLDIQEVTIINDAPPTYPIGDTTVTWTITDAAGLVSETEQLVRVLDTTPPVIEIQDRVSTEATGYEGNAANLGDVGVYDISDIAAITNDAPETFVLGGTTVTWRAADIYGNTGIAVQTVEIVDTTPPSIFAPSDVVSEYAGDSGNAVEIGIPVVADLVGISDITNNAPRIFEPGITKVTWSVTDSSGNEASAVQTVSVTDTREPVIVVPPNIVAEAAGPDGTPVYLGPASATDVSGQVRIDNDGPVLYDLGSTVVTWSATDPGGNTAMDTQIVTIQDTVPPKLNAPTDITGEAESQHGNTVNIGTATGHDTAGSVAISNNAPEAYSVGTTIVTWTAIDSSGNAATEEQSVTLVDTTQPAITAPDDVTAEATEGGTVVEIGEADAEDTVRIASVTNDAPDLYDVGMTTVTWTAVDGAGNRATDTQVITVSDTTAPYIAAPLGFSREATSAAGNVIDIGAPAYSDEAGAVTVTNNAPATFGLGQTIVLWTATDESGNEHTVSQKITLTDTTPPEITPPQDVEAEATSHEATVVDIGIASALDAIGVESISNDAPPAFAPGTTVVTWTAADTSGNTASATQEITIVDTMPPVLDIPDDIVLEAESSDPIAIDIGTPYATDLGSKTITITNNAPGAFEPGRTHIVWTVSDESGNIASKVQTVTIVDTTPPALSAPDDIVVEADSPSGTVLHVGEATTSDNTGVVELTNDAPETFPIGKTLVTWTAKDTSGIESRATQLVDVVDTTAPRVVPASDIAVEAASSDGTPVALPRPYTYDAVGIKSIRNNAPDMFGVGQTVVTWTVTDESENEGVAFQTVTVTDSTAPIISQVADVSIDAISPITSVDIEPPTSTDTIDPSPLITTDAPVGYPLGTTTIVWNAVDASGNTSSVTQSVTVLVCGKSHTAYNEVSGTMTDDTLDGTDGADLIFGLAGDDVINGGGFDDCIFGGDGDDILIGGPGNDMIYGGQGDDIIRGQQDDDMLAGAQGVDVVNGGAGTDTCIDPDFQDALSRCEN